MAVNTYLSNGPKAPIHNICPPPADVYETADLMKLYPGGVASDRLIPDQGTGRISAAQISAHIAALEGSGVLKPRPMLKVASEFETNMEALTVQDAQLYNNLQAEYCYYEQRYQYALKTFLQKATSRNQSDNTAATEMLNNTKLLNLRVNSVLEIMNYMAAARVSTVNQNKSAIDKYNASINAKLAKLKTSYAMLNKDNAILLTQRESVRYTEEKNNYTTNQIALWSALNILALGTIFYVYRA